MPGFDFAGRTQKPSPPASEGEVLGYAVPVLDCENGDCSWSHDYLWPYSSDDQDWGSIFDKIGGVVLKVLKNKNPCSSFFNSSPLVQLSAAGNTGPLSGLFASNAADFFKSDNLEPNTGQKWPNATEAETNEGTGLNSMIGVNASASGAFFAPIGTLGPFQSNSLGGRSVSILHELAHTLLLIPPDDSASVKAGFPSSEQNTQTVLDHCLKAVLQALKGQ